MLLKSEVEELFDFDAQWMLFRAAIEANAVETCRMVLALNEAMFHSWKLHAILEQSVICGDDLLNQEDYQYSPSSFGAGGEYFLQITEDDIYDNIYNLERRWNNPVQAACRGNSVEVLEYLRSKGRINPGPEYSEWYAEATGHCSVRILQWLHDAGVRHDIEYLRAFTTLENVAENRIDSKNEGYDSMLRWWRAHGVDMKALMDDDE